MTAALHKHEYPFPKVSLGWSSVQRSVCDAPQSMRLQGCSTAAGATVPQTEIPPLAAAGAGPACRWVLGACPLPQLALLLHGQQPLTDGLRLFALRFCRLTLSLRPPPQKPITNIPH